MPICCVFALSQAVLPPNQVLFLTPEVAANYGIVRSKFNALVNISVLDKVSGAAQRADVTGTAKNLIGNARKLTFKKVEEGDAIYYLAVLPFRDQETFRFEIDVQKGSSKQTLKFQQKIIQEKLKFSTKNKNIRINCISAGGINDNQPALFKKKYNKTIDDNIIKKDI